MIFLVLAGTVIYERHLTAQGEIGPIARLLDFAGIAEYEEEPPNKVKVITESFRMELRNNLSRLHEKHQCRH